MSHVRLFYHTVTITKCRKDAIVEQHERQLFRYVLAVCNSHNIIRQKEHHRTIDLADEMKVLSDQVIDEHTFE